MGGAVSRFCESGDSMWVAQWTKAQLAVVQARSTVRVFKTDAAIRKPFCRWVDFRRKPSGLRRSRAANAFQKGIPNRGINFKDAYRTWMTFSSLEAMTKSTSTHWRLASTSATVWLLPKHEKCEFLQQSAGYLGH